MPTTTFGKLTGDPYLPKPVFSYGKVPDAPPTVPDDPPEGQTRENLSRIVDYATPEDMPPPDLSSEVAAALLSRLEQDAERRMRDEENTRRSCLEFAIKYEGADDKPADVVARAGTYYDFIKKGIPPVVDPDALG